MNRTDESNGNHTVEDLLAIDLRAGAGSGRDYEEIERRQKRRIQEEMTRSAQAWVAEREKQRHETRAARMCEKFSILESYTLLKYGESFMNVMRSASSSNRSMDYATWLEREIEEKCSTSSSSTSRRELSDEELVVRAGDCVSYIMVSHLAHRVNRTIKTVEKSNDEYLPEVRLVFVGGDVLTITGREYMGMEKKYPGSRWYPIHAFRFVRGSADSVVEEEEEETEDGSEKKKKETKRSSAEIVRAEEERERENVKRMRKELEEDNRRMFQEAVERRIEPRTFFETKRALGRHVTAEERERYEEALKAAKRNSPPEVIVVDDDDADEVAVEDDETDEEDEDCYDSDYDYGPMYFDEDVGETVNPKTEERFRHLKRRVREMESRVKTNPESSTVKPNETLLTYVRFTEGVLDVETVATSAISKMTGERETMMQNGDVLPPSRLVYVNRRFSVRPVRVGDLTIV